MDAVTFGFVVLPAVLCLVGFVFSLVFAGDILRWLSDTKAAEAKARGDNSPEFETHEPQDTYRPQRVPCIREKELVSR